LMQPDNPRITSNFPTKPYSLDEIKEQANVTFSEDDQLLERYGQAAADRVESYTGRRLIEAEFLWTLDSFVPDRGQDFYFEEHPRGGGRKQIIQLPVLPLKEVTGIEYLDSNGNAQGLVIGTDVQVDATNGRMAPEPNCYWPCVERGRLSPIQINFTAGYSGDYDGLPAKIKHVINSLAAYWYECREAFTAIASQEMPEQFSDLLAEFKTERF